jgi:hypothetical protein
MHPFSLLPWLCSLVFIWTPNVTFTNRCVLSMCHTPSWTITPKQIDVPLRGSGAPKWTHAPVNHHISWTIAPLPWVHPYLVCFLVSIDMNLCGCANGAIQPLQCTHAVRSRWVHSLGACARSQIVARKVKCVPPWCHKSPLCTQGALSHTHMSSFNLPIACPFFSLAWLIPKSAQGVHVLDGCHMRPYN